ncbi:MFAP5 [Cervus elaphus hippelaphus]|uniref:MFAP5 n=1 Tax=Cervus elaphus hippelaphus TaxID=46360 RepID=A0A212CD75_CEREH|nr:MFAP5 [Cervus elaphus hippelaphus]
MINSKASPVLSFYLTYHCEHQKTTNVTSYLVNDPATDETVLADIKPSTDDLGECRSGTSGPQGLFWASRNTHDGRQYSWFSQLSLPSSIPLTMCFLRWVSSECRDEKFACTRLYSVHRPIKQCLHQICFTR